MADVEQVGMSILSELANGGLFYAIPLFGLASMLFFEGRKRIPLTVGVVGFLIGFTLGEFTFAWLPSSSAPVTIQEFQVLFGVFVAGLAVALAELAMRFLAAGLVYFVVLHLIETGQFLNVDLEGDAFLSGVLALTAFGLSIAFRKSVPVLMAGLVGSYGMMVAVYVAMSWPLGRLDGVTAPDAYLSLVGMLVSTLIQLRLRREEEEGEAKKSNDEDRLFA
jgi:hypothetical protein